MARLFGDRKPTVTQITSHGIQRSLCVSAQHIKPLSRWSSAAENYTGYHNCQLNTEIMLCISKTKLDSGQKTKQM